MMGRAPSAAMPKQMLPAMPPRRISSVSARKLTEILSSCSSTRESEKLPLKVIRWSVAMDPATAICPPSNLPESARSTAPLRVQPSSRDPGGARAVRGPFVDAAGAAVLPTGQLKLSPQAQELPALGLSMVNPCFSIVSAKSMVAPSR